MITITINTDTYITFNNGHSPPITNTITFLDDQEDSPDDHHQFSSNSAHNHLNLDVLKGDSIHRTITNIKVEIISNKEDITTREDSTIREVSLTRVDRTITNKGASIKMPNREPSRIITMLVDR